VFYTEQRKHGPPKAPERQKDYLMNQPQCPEWWPLPDGRPVGQKRAAELAAFVRQHATPVIEIARSYLSQRHPGQDIRVRASQPASLAKQALARNMTGIPVGTVSIGKGSTGHTIRIALDRDGHITANLSKPTEPVMRSVSM
jgi:hypothetical protein